MLDFTSALYLGFTHPSASLAPWRTLTLGRPAALEEHAGSRVLARDLAQLTGGAAGLLYPSTLHLFRDVFQIAAAKETPILFDSAAYPITRWGAEQAALNGTALETFPHHDADALERRLRRTRRSGQRPLIVTDGLCPSCGRAAPLPALASIAASAGGRLIIDDTQGLGVLGREPSPVAPLGAGGTGTIAWYGLAAPHAIVGASLAKAFGVPMAVLTGTADFVERAARDGETRIHASPPSAADIAAARNALTVNRAQGDGLRIRIVRLVEQLRDGLRRIGAELVSALPIPMQTIAMPSLRAAKAVLAALEASGIRALITRSCRHTMPSLTLLITARHTPADIARTLTALAGAMSAAQRLARTRLEAA